MTVRLPNEKVGILQGAARSIIQRDWYRWFRSTDRTVNSMAQNFVFAAYGIETYTGPFPDLGATYQTLDFYTIPVPPRGITFDLTANTISVDYPGVYNFAFSGALVHVKDNLLETTNIRAYNVTQTAAGIPFPISLAAQSTVTNISRTILVELDPADVYRLEIGGGDVVTGVSWSGLNVSITNVGEWRAGELP